MKIQNINSANTAEEPIVKHEGIVTKITNDVVTISLKGNINCEACKAKGACGISESEAKEVEILNTNQPIKLNESVEVLLTKNLGFKAVFWAYVFPFILMLAVLLVSNNYLQEWVAGVLTLAVLIPYYLLLYVLKNTFKKVFKLSILKMA